MAIADHTLIIHGEADWLPLEVRKSFFLNFQNVKHLTLPETGYFASQEILNKFLISVLELIE